MRILALDAAERRVGWALGDSGRKPEIGVFELKDKDERIEEALPRFALWLEDQLRGGPSVSRPVDLVAVEAFIPVGAPIVTTAATQEAAILMHGAIRAVCGLNDTAARSIPAATIRKHFCGQASGAPRRKPGFVRSAAEQRSNREATKRMVIRQAQLLGYIPPDCADDDMADAAALYDFASSHFANKAARFQLT